MFSLSGYRRIRYQYLDLLRISKIEKKPQKPFELTFFQLESMFILCTIQ